MSGPARMKLPPRREHRTDRMTWRPVGEGGPEFRFHLSVGFWPEGPGRLGAPLEIFLKSGGQQGSMLDELSDDIGELLSLALQHGHTLDALRRRFKPGSLAHATCRRAREIAREEGPAENHGDAS